VMNYDLDTYKYKKENNPNARKNLLELKEPFEIEDIFRVLHPDIKQYTWSHRNPTKMARLDYFLISPDIFNLDHSLVHFEVNFINNSKGQGYWKFNSSLLHEPVYVTEIKQTIQDSVKQYKIEGEPNEVTFNISCRHFWETLKMSIRGNTIRYSAREKKRKRI
jgi:hypothetical protein